MMDVISCRWAKRGHYETL